MYTSLASAIWPQSQNSLIYKTVLVLVGTALLAVSAKVQVPFWPVPMTMQTFVVLLIGASFGARMGAITVLAYLAEGAVGLPVFAKGAGLAYMFGPTGGYLLGFLVATTFVGRLSDQGYGRTVLSTFLVFFAGEIILFTFGVGWLASLIGIEKAIAGGLVPFLPAEALKLVLAVVVLPFAWRITRKG